MRRLLIRPGAIGDFILALPSLEFLKSTVTEVWCAEQNVPLARFADSARSITGAGLDRVGLLPAGDVLARLAEFDEIYSWYGTRNPDFREQVAHLPIRFFPSLPTDGRQHATDFFCAQVNAPVSAPRIEVPQGAREAFTIIHPFASSPAKRWPVDRFLELASNLPEVRWCAGPEEVFDGAVRISDLYELACWLARARLYIGNDSGITHLAAAVGTPVIALFGPTDPAVWAPRGRNVTVIHRESMAEITLDEVRRCVTNLI